MFVANYYKLPLFRNYTENLEKTHCDLLSFYMFSFKEHDFQRPTLQRQDMNLERFSPRLFFGKKRDQSIKKTERKKDKHINLVLV